MPKFLIRNSVTGNTIVVEAEGIFTALNSMNYPGSNVGSVAQIDPPIPSPLMDDFKAAFERLEFVANNNIGFFAAVEAEKAFTVAAYRAACDMWLFSKQPEYHKPPEAEPVHTEAEYIRSSLEPDESILAAIERDTGQLDRLDTAVCVLDKIGHDYGKHGKVYQVTQAVIEIAGVLREMLKAGKP